MKTLQQHITNNSKTLNFRINRNTAPKSNDDSNLDDEINELIDIIFYNPEEKDKLYSNVNFKFYEKIKTCINKMWPNDKENVISYIDKIKAKYSYVPEIFPKNQYNAILIKYNIQNSSYYYDICKLYNKLIKYKEKSKSQKLNNWTQSKYEYEKNYNTLLSLSTQYMIFFLIDDTDIPNSMILVKF